MTEKTFRDLFKWGDPNIEDEIDNDLLDILKSRINFKFEPLSEIPGNEPITDTIDHDVDNSLVEDLSNIVGDQNIYTTIDKILEFAYGSSYTDVLKQRHKKFDTLPLAVVSPKSENDIIDILKVCSNYGLGVIPAGGKSSVTEGIKYSKSGIALDLTKHLNKIIEINDIDNTVTVQAGIMGPVLENMLNSFSSQHNKNGFTCGHFPQSFEFSTVGGWVVTRGAGQESTGYGKIENMVLGLKMISPNGIIDIKPYPAKATGPDIIQTIVGSEGSYGIVTQITLKIREIPASTQYGAILFRTWDNGLKAVRKIMQQRSGKPNIFRLSDPEESDIYLEMAHIPGWQQWILEKLGYEKGERVLLLCSTVGTKRYSKTVMKEIRDIASEHGGRYIGSTPVKEWLKDRFHTPYLRAAMMDQNLVIDTLETATTWKNLKKIWSQTRSTIKQRPNTICMTHLSHFYENGANLYFIFITKEEEGNDIIENYQNYQKEIIQSIIDAGGSLSHHHGIGRLYVPWMEQNLGSTQIEIMRSIKGQLDPENLMNPGVLGL